jgi:hypothetical protein
MEIKKSGPDDLKIATNAGASTAVTLANTVHPLLGVAVGIAAALFGPAIERRQDRAEDLILYIQEHIADFTPQVLEDKKFQDGFVLLMEKYIRERNDDKRVILQHILKGYIHAPNLLEYPLEEMAELVSRIRMSDVAILRNAFEEESRDASANPNNDPKSFMLREDPNAVSRLIYFGLLHEDRTKSGPVIREYDQKNYLYVWVSPAGREFAKHLGSQHSKAAAGK